MKSIAVFVFFYFPLISLSQGVISGTPNTMFNVNSFGTIDPALNFGIGTLSPTHNFHVFGDVRLETLQTDSLLDSILVVDGQGIVHFRSAYSLPNSTASGPDDDWKRQSPNLVTTYNALCG